MSDTSVTGAGRRHFTPEDEEMLHRNESTNDIVKRDTKTTVSTNGRDLSRREVADLQNHHVGAAGYIEIGKTAIEGLDISGVTELAAHAAVHYGANAKFVAGLEIGLVVGAPVAAFALGMHQLAEAHEQGDQQNAAIIRENVHVATICALQLPEDYKIQRLDHDYKSVPRNNDSPANKMAELLMKDPKGLAVLQLHCDQGMNAARDLLASHKDVATFLKENPKVADAYAKDAAFHEGFDAYLSTKSRAALDQQLNERDGWYAQSHVSFRV